MAGHCFRCDESADGDLCPRCGSQLYREQKLRPVTRSNPPTVGEEPGNLSGGPSLRVIIAIVAIALLLVAIAVVAASSSGIA